MKGIMINFIKTGKQGHILGLILLAVAAMAAGCATKAEAIKPGDSVVPKKETVAATQTPSYRTSPDPYSERQYDGDMEYSTPVPKRKAADLTKSSFDRIKVGMSLAEVEKMLGEEGMLVSSMDVNGRKTQLYKWSNDNFTSYIDVTIEDAKVVEKKSKGLK